MLRFVIGLITLFCTVAISGAVWVMLPLEEVVLSSDIIVVGTLKEVDNFSGGGMDYGTGYIEVEDVIWGSVESGGVLRLNWHNPSGLLCPRVDHRDKEGKSGVWLLTQSEPGASPGDVRADYPWRFTVVDKKEAITSILRDNPIALRFSNSSILGEPLLTTLVFRNASAETLVLPGLQVQQGVLFLDPKLDLKLYFGQAERGSLVLPEPGRLTYSSSVEPVVLEPHQGGRLTFDLSQVFPIESSGSYALHLESIAHHVITGSFYVRESE